MLPPPPPLPPLPTAATRPVARTRVEDVRGPRRTGTSGRAAFRGSRFLRPPLFFPASPASAAWSST
jgi:hypothetical protein